MTYKRVCHLFLFNYFYVIRNKLLIPRHGAFFAIYEACCIKEGIYKSKAEKVLKIAL